MKLRPVLVSIATIALYAVTLLGAWSVCTHRTKLKTIRLLEQSEQEFIDSVNDCIDILLIHVAHQINRRYEGRPKDPSVEEMQRLNETYGIDELEFVNERGICTAASISKIVGYDYATMPETAAFLVLTNRGPGRISQDFRRGAVNPDFHGKYLGWAYGDGTGFIELGYDYERMVRAVRKFSSSPLRSWRIGQSGYYEFLTPALAEAYQIPPDLPDHQVAEGWIDGEAVYCRAFSYAGERYLSVLHQWEYFGERNFAFLVLTPILTIVVILLVFYIRSLVRAEKSEASRRLAEDAARVRDLSVASAIQHSALPSVDVLRSELFSYSFDAVYRPAREVGGDFYDFYFVTHTRIAFVIADVAGKGVPAAMFMMKAKNEIFNAIVGMRDLVEAMQTANQRLCEHNEAEMFVTVWAGIFDTTSGEIEFVNAGHNRPFLRHADGKVEQLPLTGGVFLGSYPNARYRAARIVMQPGDTILLYTDGVTEAMDSARRLYGEERLRSVLAEAGGDIRGLLSAVEKSVIAFQNGAERSDDHTALAATWHGLDGLAQADFPARTDSFGAAMTFMREHLDGENAKALTRLLNAADEVMSNIVNYSGASVFTIQTQSAPGRLRIDFTDDGREYNPLSHVDPDTHAALQDRPIGGLGILMVKKLVSTVAYDRLGNRNHLSLFVDTKGEGDGSHSAG